MYWTAAPSKPVRNSSEWPSAAGSAGCARFGGQRRTSDHRAKWMNERSRNGWATRALSRASSQLNRIQPAHHHGTALRIESGLAANRDASLLGSSTAGPATS